MKTFCSATIAIITLFGAALIGVSGCTDAPPSFGESPAVSDPTSATIFPLAEGSYWNYSYAFGGFPTDNPTSVRSDAFPIPLEISSTEQRYYYLDEGQEDKRFNYGPATAHMTTDFGILGKDLGYMANDTMVVIGREFGDRYGGKGLLLREESYYMPLKPVVGHSYVALNEARYTGTEQIALPVYTGEVHVFTNDLDTFIFAEGVGLVRYEFDDPTRPLQRKIMTLKEYRIGP